MEFLCCFFYTLDSSKAASCSHDAKTVFATVVPTDSQQGNTQRVKGFSISALTWIFQVLKVNIKVLIDFVNLKYVAIHD